MSGVARLAAIRPRDSWGSRCRFSVLACIYGAARITIKGIPGVASYAPHRVGVCGTPPLGYTVLAEVAIHPQACCSYQFVPGIARLAAVRHIQVCGCSRCRVSVFARICKQAVLHTGSIIKAIPIITRFAIICFGRVCYFPRYRRAVFAWVIYPAPC